MQKHSLVNTFDKLFKFNFNSFIWDCQEILLIHNNNKTTLLSYNNTTKTNKYQIRKKIFIKFPNNKQHSIRRRILQNIYETFEPPNRKNKLSKFILNSGHSMPGSDFLRKIHSEKIIQLLNDNLLTCNFLNTTLYNHAKTFSKRMVDENLISSFNFAFQYINSALFSKALKIYCLHFFTQ